MSADQIRKVAVVGAGTMGPGMAATFARNGFDTTLVVHRRIGPYTSG